MILHVLARKDTCGPCEFIYSLHFRRGDSVVLIEYDVERCVVTVPSCDGLEIVCIEAEPYTGYTSLGFDVNAISYSIRQVSNVFENCAQLTKILLILRDFNRQMLIGTILMVVIIPSSVVDF